MKTRISKTLVKDACIQKQQELIDSFKTREAELYDATYNRNAIDSQTESRQAAKTEILEAMGNELEFVQKELTILNAIDFTEETNSIEAGAIVVTDKLTFFIAISCEKLEIEGQEFFGISINAPIYANMVGLQKGSSFEFNEKKYVIEDVY